MKNKCFKFILLLFVLLQGNNSYSQSLSINTTGSVADTSAILDIKSTSKGLLIPRVTNSQKNSIYQPATGLLVYQTDDKSGFYYYTGTSWLLLATASMNAANTTLIYTTKGF